MKTQMEAAVIRVITVAVAIQLQVFPASLASAETANEIVGNMQRVYQTGSCIGCNLTGADFNRAELSQVNFAGAILRDATFYLADLSNADFRNADLQGCEFGGADVSNADFRGAILVGTVFDGAYQKGTLFGNTGDSLANDQKADTLSTGKSRKTQPVVKMELIEDPGETEQTLDHDDIIQHNSIAPPVKRVVPFSGAVVR